MKALIFGTILSTLAVSTAILTESCSKDSNNTTSERTDPNNEIPPAPIGENGNLYQNKYGKSLVYFAEVDKAGDYYRRMFIDTASASAFLKSGTLPNGALLIMETWFGNNQSTVFVRQKMGNGWLSDSFSPSSPRYEGLVSTSSCNGCHATARSTEDTFTRPLLLKALNRKTTQKIICNERSTTPCDLSVYQGS